MERKSQQKSKQILLNYICIIKYLYFILIAFYFSYRVVENGKETTTVFENDILKSKTVREISYR